MGVTALCASRTFHFIAAGLLVLALATVAAAEDAPQYTKAKDYPLPQGTSSWAAVMSDVLQNKVLGLPGSQANACLHSCANLSCCPHKDTYAAAPQKPGLPASI